MAPLSSISLLVLGKRAPLAFPELPTHKSPPNRDSLGTADGMLESWAQGYHVGSLIILILIVFCNYRSGILLHKLILLELVLAIWHGTFIFVPDPAYGWYLSATATLLFISYFLHNIVSWIKIRPFLPRWGSRAFIISLLCVQPFWIAEAWSNFAYFNGLGSDANVRMRPWEALIRDPWWIFTTWKLLDAIRQTYGFNLWTLVNINRRFGIMILCMFLSIVFLLTDVGVTAARVSAESGINPFWRFALVFKCASDTIFLDDFKSVLDDIVAHKFSSTGDIVHGGFIVHHRHDSSKRSRSASRGPVSNESHDLTHTRIPVRSRPKRSRLQLPCHKETKQSKVAVPLIQIKKDYTIISHIRTPTPDGWNNPNSVIPRPEHAVHSN
ncbi:hypothetical protein ACN47E_000077 [Coniothyrium glycines]